jgi:NAD(P)-dependent dehydrogenase (short-subunit alcohol dehydrogenase family)
MNSSVSNARPLVITGASSGIGRAAALYLDRLGFRVFAGFRNPIDAEALVAEASPNLVPVHLDVTQIETIEKARDQIAESLAGEDLFAIVNNAATTVTMPVEFMDLDALRGQLEINTIGVVAVTKTMLPLLSRPGGRVVNVSSGAGRIVSPLIGAYCGSKYALVALTDALRLEVRGQGIRVSIIEPGFIDTPMHEKNERQVAAMLEALPAEGRTRYGAAFDKLAAANTRMAKNAAPPESVAKAIHRALCDARPRTRYPVTPEAKLLHWIGPFLNDRMRDAIFGRMMGL